jgi:hypothetical protein
MASATPETPAAEAADAPPLVLEHLTVADGLPQAAEMAALQGLQGSLRIGTEAGPDRARGGEGCAARLVRAEGTCSSSKTIR